MFSLTSGYNRFAGLDINRTKSIADGVFAFALTLLVLGLSIPVSTGISGEHQLWLQLALIGPSWYIS